MSDTLTDLDVARLGIESQALTIRDIRAINAELVNTHNTHVVLVARLETINAELLAALEDIAAKFAKVRPGHGYYANTLAIKLMPAVQGAIAKAQLPFLPPT